MDYGHEDEKFSIASCVKMLVSTNPDFLFQKIQVFIPLKSMAGPVDHYEVSAWVPVTIPNPNVDRLKYFVLYDRFRR
jgi:hypothetical protein